MQIAMRVLRRYVGTEGKPMPGDVVHVTPQRAARLEARGQACRLVSAPAYRCMWERATVCIVAGGPSLVESDVRAAKARGWKMLGVNDAYRMLPELDALYACDGKFWRAHHADLPAGLRGKCYTRDSEAAAQYGLHHVPSSNGRGLCLDAGRIHEGGNSGYQAMNLAYHAGASRMVLLGFDMRRGKGGRKHWFGDHPAGLNVESPYDVWIEKFGPLALDLALNGVEVINASRETALRCFERRPLETVAD